ncbi:MAG: DUF898 family protein [Rhizobacter sp.]|nr:DUF898 family protein [Bacteriovorax sp.]
MFDDVEISSSKTKIHDRLVYSGSGTELAIIMFQNIALTILTLGIYSAWGRTNTRRYVWGKVSFLGDRGSYSGSGMELFRGWMIVVAFYMVIAICLNIISRINPFLVVLATPLYVYLYALAIYGGARYRLSRTSWRETNFSMERNKESTQTFIWLVVKGVLLSGLTLGLYLPYFQNEKRRFLINKASFGTSKFNFTGDNGEFFKLVLWNLFLTFITLGFYGSWMILNLAKYKLKNSNLDNKLYFDIKLEGKSIFFFSVLSYLATICTLGLALPWVINKSYHIFINAIEVTGEIDFAAIQNVEISASAFGDVAAVEYDLDLGF